MFSSIELCTGNPRSVANLYTCDVTGHFVYLVHYLLMFTTRHEKAEKLCLRLLDECPHNPDVWMLLIEVHKHQGSSHLDQVMISM